MEPLVGDHLSLATTFRDDCLKFSIVFNLP